MLYGMHSTVPQLAYASAQLMLFCQAESVVRVYSVFQSLCGPYSEKFRRSSTSVHFILKNKKWGRPGRLHNDRTGNKAWLKSDTV